MHCKTNNFLTKRIATKQNERAPSETDQKNTESRERKESMKSKHNPSYPQSVKRFKTQLIKPLTKLIKSKHKQSNINKINQKRRRMVFPCKKLPALLTHGRIVYQSWESMMMTSFSRTNQRRCIQRCDSCYLLFSSFSSFSSSYS